MDGRYNIDNNGIENAVRPVAVGRKNYLFCQNDDTAESTAIIYSFMGCCKAAGVDFRTWMIYFLDHIHDYDVFMVLYSLCGISDVFDGYIARKMNQQSTLGAKLDSIADFIMYMIVIIVLCLWDLNAVVDFIPFLAPVSLLRGVNIGVMYSKFHQLGVIHTIGNKIVGLFVYSIPLIYIFMSSLSFLWFMLPLLIIVPLEETCIILRMKELDLDRKGFSFPNVLSLENN